MRIVLAQINPIVGDIAGNKIKIINIIKDEKKHADLIVFPEMALLGYPPDDLLLLSDFLQEIDEALKEIMKASTHVAVIVGVVRRHHAVGEKPLCNSAAVIEDGKLLGFQDKMLLPTYDVFDEQRFFEPAIKMQVWKLKGSLVGITICEDIWKHGELLKYSAYTQDPVIMLAKLKPNFVVNLSASPFSMSHIQARILTCRRVTKTLQCPLFLCNQVGANDSLIFDGSSLAFNKDGQLVGMAHAFQEDKLLIELSRMNSSILFTSDPMNELYQALVLGVRDYFFKSGFKKACIGLSGGIDSALVACIAVEALGAKNVIGILMPSRYSSTGSIADASQLVNTLGIHSETISIEKPFQTFLDLLSPTFKNIPADVTEENMQARIRGMILMAMSNKFGYIVLSTGNKSELAMGYATLYGDMCGGLAVINDVTKRNVYELSRWINRTQEVIPWNTIEKPPSAELKLNQKDSDSLPDYDVIDNVLEAYLEQYQSPMIIAKRFGYSKELVDGLIQRIHRNEFKRRQGALGLRVSGKSFSVGRRFPVVHRWECDKEL